MKTIIIGGGLTGLRTAHFLSEAGHDVQVLDARDRLGGRILTRDVAGSAFDLGPTWFWPSFQTKFPALLNELGLTSFTQHTQGAMRFEPRGQTAQTIPPQDAGPSSYRVAGGMGAVIDAIHARLPEDCVMLKAKGAAVTETDDGIQVTLEDGRVAQGDRCVLALPPRIAAAHIRFEPVLPNGVLETWRGVPTWMAGHAKILAVYHRPFWRDAGLSGQAFSYQGPCMEIHDASPVDGDDSGPGGLFGFLAVPAAQRRTASDAAVKHACLDQFIRLFGEQAARPQDLLYLDWAGETATATAEDLAPPPGHPRYGLSEGLQTFWSGKLRLAVTETASENGGYLEGALEAAEGVVSRLI